MKEGIKILKGEVTKQTKESMGLLVYNLKLSSTEVLEDIFYLEAIGEDLRLGAMLSVLDKEVILLYVIDRVERDRVRCKIIYKGDKNE